MNIQRNRKKLRNQELNDALELNEPLSSDNLVSKNEVLRLYATRLN